MQPSSSTDLQICRWKSCSIQLHSTLELKNHIEQDHLGTNKASYRCDWAGCNFGERRKIYDLKTHVTLHHQHLSHFCRTCNKGFLRDQELRKHHHIGCQPVAASTAGRLQSPPNSSPQYDNIHHAPSPVSSEGGMEVPHRDDSGEWSDHYEDHSSPAEVPVFTDSKKRQRGEAVDPVFDSVKREKIEPVPTKESLNFLAIKKNIESMPLSQLNVLLDDMYYGPLSEELDAESLEFAKESTEEDSLAPILESIEVPLTQITDEQMVLMDSLHSTKFFAGEEFEEVPSLSEDDEEASSIFDILSVSPAPSASPRSLHAIPSIMSRPAPVIMAQKPLPPSAPAAPSLASSVVFPTEASKKKKNNEVQPQGIATRSAVKKALSQVPQLPSPAKQTSLPDGFRLHQPQENATLASLNSRNIPSPAVVPSSKPSYFAVPPSFVSPGEFSSDMKQRRAKDAAAGSGSFIPLFMSSPSYLVSPGSGSPNLTQSRHATTSAAPPVSLYDRYSEKDGEEMKVKTKTLLPLQGPSGRRLSAAEFVDPAKMVDLLHNLDIKDKDKDKEDNTIPPKPTMPTSHIHLRKGSDGLISTTSPSPTMQSAVRFSKQDVFGMIERLLKRM